MRRSRRRKQPAISGIRTKTRPARSAMPTCSGPPATRNIPANCGIALTVNYSALIFHDRTLPEVRPTSGASTRQRWSHFGAHIHWVLDVDGKETLRSNQRREVESRRRRPRQPAARTVVALGKAKDVSQVKHVFLVQQHLGSRSLGIAQSQRRLRRDEPARSSLANAQSMD